MWILTCVVLLAAGYVASIYSWPAIKIRINGAAAEIDRLRERAVALEIKLRNL